MDERTLRKSRNERNRKQWTKRSSKHRIGERIMSQSNEDRGPIRGPARNLFTPENYNGASATREFVPLLPTTKKRNKYREHIRGVGKNWTRFIERCAFSASHKKLFYYRNDGIFVLHGELCLPRVKLLIDNV